MGNTLRGRHVTNRMFCDVLPADGKLHMSCTSCDEQMGNYILPRTSHDEQMGNYILSCTSYDEQKGNCTLSCASYDEQMGNYTCHVQHMMSSWEITLVMYNI